MPQGRWINSSKRRSTSWESCWKGAEGHECFSAIAYVLLLTSTQNTTYLLVLLVQNKTLCARPTWLHREEQLLRQRRLWECLSFSRDASRNFPINAKSVVIGLLKLQSAIHSGAL